MSFNTQREHCDTCGVDGWKHHEFGCAGSAGVMRIEVGAFDKLLEDYDAVEKLHRLDGTRQESLEEALTERDEAVRLGAEVFRLASQRWRPA